MSNRLCNHCIWKRMQQTYKGQKLKLRENTEYELGGVDVYLDGKLIAWFMELTDTCCC